MNGSVANGTIRTIPKSVEKNDECSNGDNSSSYPLHHALLNDAPTNFLPRQDNLGYQRVPNECSVLNKHFPGNINNNLEYANSSISQGTTVPAARDEKFTALQHKNYNFAPLHVECDPVSNSLDIMCILSN